jgi:predicted ArsR family transcriptional regulator
MGKNCGKVKNVSGIDPDASRHRALAHPLRLRLLRLLEDAGPLDVHALAERLGLSPNGVRRHLDLLLGAGLVSKAGSSPSRPGRPRLLYRAEQPARSERVGYPLLADMLAGALSRVGDDGAVEAEGRRWGRLLVERPLPPVPLDADAAAARLEAMLARLGFAPDGSADSGERIDIHRCPFLDTARAYPGVVCALHLGLMRGALAELEAPLEAERLDRLVEPGLCVVHLRRSADAAS